MIPNEPPESGGVRRRSRSPRRPSAAAATPWSVNGPWKFAHAVSLPAASSQSQTTPKHSTGMHVNRGTRNVSRTTIGPFERLVDVAVVERAVVDRRRLEGVENGIERLVVDGDELGRVLGDVPVARDDDGEGLADVPRGSDGGGVVRDRRLDACGTASRGARRPPGQHAAHAVERERGGRVDRHPRVGELRADDRRMPGVRDGLEVVDEPPLAAEERLVLDALERAPDPWCAPRRRPRAEHRTRRWLPARDPQPCGGELLVRRPRTLERPERLEHRRAGCA